MNCKVGGMGSGSGRLLSGLGVGWGYGLATIILHLDTSWPKTEDGGPKMVPRWLKMAQGEPRWFQNAPNSRTVKVPHLTERAWGPNMAQDGPKMASREPQDGSMMASRWLKMVQGEQVSPGWLQKLTSITSTITNSPPTHHHRQHHHPLTTTATIWYSHSLSLITEHLGLVRGRLAVLALPWQACFGRLVCLDRAVFAWLIYRDRVNFSVVNQIMKK